MNRNSFFFYPNACYVCKIYGEYATLRTCTICKMISYCGAAHEKYHRPQHQEICNAIHQMRSNNEMINVRSTREEWCKRAMAYIKRVEEIMGRTTSNEEKQMFMYQQVCEICFRNDVFVNCHDCPCSSMCIDHVDSPLHKVHCSQLKLCFQLDIINFRTYENFLHLGYLESLSGKMFSSNMELFLNMYVLPYYCERETLPCKYLRQAAHSEIITAPLTLYYAMRLLNFGYLFDSYVTAHIIVTKKVDLITDSAWEVLLHTTSLISLHIIVVGLESQKYMQLLTRKLCDMCSQLKKKLSLTGVCVPYPEYAFSKKFRKPDVIITYDWSLNNLPEINFTCNSWTQTIQVVANQICPFIIASPSKASLEVLRHKINKYIGIEVEHSYCGDNPYRSLRPHRKFMDAGTLYRNNYILVYKKLCL